MRPPGAGLPTHALGEQADQLRTVMLDQPPQPSDQVRLPHHGLRFSLAQQHDLIESLAAPSTDGKRWGRIGVDFGSVSLCHVAAGFTDATIEFAKGFAAWDLYPGHYILNAAGGTIIDLDGKPIPLDYSLDSSEAISAAMSRRQKFIAASTPQLADALLRSLRP